uniref:EF-hand domain-containing protein n=1 Tax=Acanthochromis polyacanthus TaxID=80966 RepID=A0A3Q1G795_9TELE
ALELPLTDMSFDDRDISLSQGPLRIYDYSCLLEFCALLSRINKEQAKRARKLQGDRLGLEDFAQFLNLPTTDTLEQVHSFFDQHGVGQIDIRRYVTALSVIHRPLKPMDTLKLAFKMYESEETGEILEEHLAVIFEIMLGVKEVDLTRMFLALGGPDTGRITYGKTPFRFLSILSIVQNCQIIQCATVHHVIDD